MTAGPSPTNARLSAGLRVAAGLALLGALIALAHQMPTLTCASVRGFGDDRWAVPLALGLGAAAILIAVPRWVVIAAAGLTFGALPGMLVAHSGAWLGACACFVVARGIARAPIERWLSRQRWYARVAPALGDRRGGWIVFWMRVNPILHFTGVSYAAGLAPIGLGAYAAGTALGMIPMTLVVAWAGEVVGCALLDEQPIEPRLQLAIAAAVVAMTLASLIPVALAWWRRRQARAAP